MVEPTNGPVGVGTHLGDRYELLREVGRGGFGAVFEARDAPLNRSVAVKLIHTSWTQAGAELEREATLLAGIRSPHVVRVLDASVMEDPPYLVMELLEGESVRERVDRVGALDASGAFQILDEVLQGLGALHERTLIHGDLKPENVFLTSEGAKLIDLGISRPWTSPQEPSSHILGTPAYLAPELIRGGQPDPRADLYAAGLLLHEMLAGRPAHRQGNHSKEVSDEIREGRRAPLTLLCPWLPLAVSAFLRRALQSDPSRRFHSAEGMRKQLNTLSRRVESATERESPLEEQTLGERFVLRRRLPAGSSGPLWEARDRQRDALVTVERVQLGEAREGIQKLAGLRSPHIPQIFDMVPLDDGVFALVMEQLQGHALTEVIGQRLPLGDLVATGGQLLAALSAAHSVGLVHGNLEPSNILVGHVGQDPLLKLLGFRLSDEPGPALNAAYAAPELLGGDGPPTFRSDVYSAGAILFELLTGLAYPAAGRPLDGSGDDLQPLGRVAAAARFTTMIQRALAPDPTERFEDARAFLAATRDSVPPEP